MSYTKITTSFKDHETVLTAAHLQHLESGIADNDIALGNRVRTDTNAQGLGTSQKRNARTNIDVPSTAEMTAAVAAESDLRSAADESLKNKTDTIQEELNKTKTCVSNLSALSSSIVNLKTIRANPVIIHDALAGDVQNLVIQLAPKRVLHGYDKPWVGGSRKNLIRSVVANGTRNGITITRNDDGTVVLNGTATALVDIYTTQESGISAGKSGGIMVPAGTYAFGSVIGGSSTSYRAYLAKWGASSSSATYSSALSGEGTVTLSEETTIDFFVRVDSGVTVNNLVVSPMVRVSSTEPGYEPYSNICPITGYDNVEVIRTGKNLFDGKLELGGISDVTGVETVTNDVVRSASYINVLPNVVYSMSRSIDTGYLNARLYDENKTYLGTSTNEDYFYGIDVSSAAQPMGAGKKSCVFMVKGKVAYIRFQDRSADMSNTYQLELGSTATDFEPYQGQTHTVNLTSVAGGTVYGGTVTINEDGSGTLVVDRVCINASALTWVTSSIANTFIATGGFVIEPSSHLSSEVFSGDTSWGYEKANYDQIYYGKDYAISWRSPGNNSAKGIAIRDSRLSAYYSSFNLSTFQTAIVGLDILYPIAPQSYSLTASQVTTLLGYNRIYTNGDTLEVTYRTEKYATKDEAFAAFATDTASGAVASFSDGADDIPLKTLNVAIEPVQDLYGYDKPWIGGAGKNLCPTMRPENQNIQSYGTVVTTINNDGSVTLNGTTANGARYYALSDPFTVTAGTEYRLSGCASGGGLNTWRLDIRYENDPGIDQEFANITDNGGGINFTPTTTHRIRISVRLSTNVTINNVTFFPMVRYATVSDPTYAPYSNICPISGWDEVNVTRCGKNLWDVDKSTKNYYLQPGSTEGGATSSSSDTSDYITVIGNKQYTLSMSNPDTANNRTIAEYDGNKTRIAYHQHNAASYTFATDPAAKYVRITYAKQATNLQFELGSTATTYEHYTAQTLSVNVKSLNNNSTVYGGTLTIYSDGSGTMVMDKANGVFAGESVTVLTVGDNGTVFQTGFNVPLENYSSNYTTSIADADSTRNNADAPYGSYVFGGTVRFKTPAYIGTTNTQISEWFKQNPVQIVYGLTIPVTYTLTATQLRTLLGSNNVWCDAGNVSITYRADVGLLIKKLMNALTTYGITL